MEDAVGSPGCEKERNARRSDAGQDVHEPNPVLADPLFDLALDGLDKFGPGTGMYADDATASGDPRCAPWGQWRQPFCCVEEPR